MKITVYRTRQNIMDLDYKFSVQCIDLNNLICS